MNKNVYSFLMLAIAVLFLDTTVYAQNNTLSFDGATDAVTVPHHNNYDLGTGDFTVEAMINISSNTIGNVPIVSTRINNQGLFGFIFYIYGTNNLLLQMNGYNSAYAPVTSGTLLDNQCHHVAASRSGTVVKFYLDGVLKSTLTSTNYTNDMTSTGPLYFGYDSYDQYFINGAISEVRLWNKAVSDANILSHYNTTLNNSTTGLIGWWAMNEASGQTVTDGSLTANNGVLGFTNAVEAADPTRVALCTNNVVTGLFEANAASNKLAVAPNPFYGETKITIDAFAADYTAEVFTLEGQLVQTLQVSNVSEFQLGSELRAGMYLLKVSSKELVQTTRILKK